MITAQSGFRLFTTLLLGSLSTLACSGESSRMGNVQLSLSSSVDEQTYQLRDANFAITAGTGSDSWLLSSEEDPDQTSLVQALPAGSYELLLQDGWRLERQGESPETVAAALVSPNPVNFAVEPGASTLVSYLFETAGTDIGFGEGDLQIQIEVEHVSLSQLVITEVMKNPSALTDAAGEWFELYNAGGGAVDLQGCTLRRDDSQTTLDASFVIEPGSYATVASTSEPGFTPSWVWSSLSLPNSALVTLGVDCHDAIIDEVAFDAISFPNEAGKSMSLDPAALSAASNDVASNWCSGSSDYNGDLGSPGAANPACP